MSDEWERPHMPPRDDAGTLTLTQKDEPPTPTGALTNNTVGSPAVPGARKRCQVEPIRMPAVPPVLPVTSPCPAWGAASQAQLR